MCNQKGLGAIGSTVQYLGQEWIEVGNENKVEEEAMVNIFLLFEAGLLGHPRNSVQLLSYF